MRLDKYLKVSRIIKRRTVAHDAAGAERIKINGHLAKASAEVHPGDILEVAFGGHTARYEVLQVTEGVGKSAAAAMARELTEDNP